MRPLIWVFINSFRGYAIAAHVAAMIVTYILVVRGIDWTYFAFVFEKIPRFFLFSADIIGFFLPFILPAGLFIVGRMRSSTALTRAGRGVMFAAIAGFVISTAYKAFTGRVSPPHHGPLIDISHQFQFGFMEYHVIGGWPSSHTTVAIAIATCLAILFSRTKWVGPVAYAIALYIGVGVTFGFHWLSEFIAGIFMGAVIGKAAADAVQTQKSV